MNVQWLEQTEADVAEGSNWLSPDEKARLATMRFPRRRADWRLGRWTAKKALATSLSLPEDPQVFADLEIRSAPSGAPRTFFEGEPTAVAISLSHRSGVGLCATVPFDIRVGCDLEVIEARSENFVADYFTDGEQSLVRKAQELDRVQLVALLWSAKESAVKVLETGLRVDTRSVIVEPQDGVSSSDWHPLVARYSDNQAFFGWWRAMGNMVRTIICDAPTQTPVCLATPVRLQSCTISP